MHKLIKALIYFLYDFKKFCSKIRIHAFRMSSNLSLRKFVLKFGETYLLTK
jgi:hypothetical protein